MKTKDLGPELTAWAVVVGAVLLFLVGCVNPDAPERKPEPEPSTQVAVIKSSQGSSLTVQVDHVSVGGMTCAVVTKAGYAPAVSCHFPPGSDSTGVEP